MTSYFPALRFKQGEYFACGMLASDIARTVVPRFILPPPKEVDPELGRRPTPDEIAYLTADRIRKNWPKREAFIDTHFIENYLRADGLARLYQLLHEHNKNLVPVVNLNDLSKGHFFKIASSAGHQLGLYLHFEEPIVASEIIRLLGEIECDVSNCTVFIDFGGAPLETEGSHLIIADVVNRLWSVGTWKRIVFQASSFPEKNLAAPGEDFISRRFEWDAYWRATKEFEVPPDRVSFGDYGADCSTISFRNGGGAKPIPHIRYSTSSATVIVRGRDTGELTEVMREVATRIVEDKKTYAGRESSRADEWVWRVANGLGTTGSPSTWRQINMLRHMTMVVQEIGAKQGVTYRKLQVPQLEEQLELV